MGTRDTASQAEVYLRSAQLVARILEGETDHIAWVKKTFNVEKSMAYQYMNKARKLIAESSDIHLEIGRSLEALHTCRAALIAKGDHQGAVRAIAETNKMLGLNKPDRVTIKGEIEGVQVYLPDNGRDKPEGD